MSTTRPTLLKKQLATIFQHHSRGAEYHLQNWIASGYRDRTHYGLWEAASNRALQIWHMMKELDT
jgi:hypothetical protein